MCNTGICGIIVHEYLCQENYYKSSFMDIIYEIIHKRGRGCANGKKRSFRRGYKG